MRARALASGLICAALAGATLVSAAGSSERPDCEYVEAGPAGPPGNVLVVRETFDELFLSRRGEEIVPSYMRCSGPQATVRNVDRIVLHGEQTTVYLKPREGPFAPGATPEVSGSEIEIVVYGGRLELGGSAGDDTIVARTLRDGRTAVNWNRQADGAAPDFDVFLADGVPGVLRLLGRNGDDVIDARRLRGMGDPYLRHVDRLLGGHGDDLILGGPGGEFRIEDGRGDDVIRSGGGEDSVFFGLGRDTIYGGRGADDLIYTSFRADAGDALWGGPGDDQLSDLNRAADALRCGPGRDLAEMDGRDRPAADCERRAG